MFGKIAAFELRYQIRQPIFWIAGLIFFLLVFGSVVIDQIQIGSGGNVHKNSPAAIAQTTGIMTLFFMFVATAFVANVVVRDDETGFGPIVRSTGSASSTICSAGSPAPSRRSACRSCSCPWRCWRAR